MKKKFKDTIPLFFLKMAVLLFITGVIWDIYQHLSTKDSPKNISEITIQKISEQDYEKWFLVCEQFLFEESIPEHIPFPLNDFGVFFRALKAHEKPINTICATHALPLKTFFSLGDSIARIRGQIQKKDLIEKEIESIQNQIDLLQQKMGQETELSTFQSQSPEEKEQEKILLQKTEEEIQRLQYVIHLKQNISKTQHSSKKLHRSKPPAHLNSSLLEFLVEDFEEKEEDFEEKEETEDILLTKNNDGHDPEKIIEEQKKLLQELEIKKANLLSKEYTEERIQLFEETQQVLENEIKQKERLLQELSTQIDSTSQHNLNFYYQFETEIDFLWNKIQNSFQKPKSKVKQ